MYVYIVITVGSSHGYRQLLELQKLRRKAKKVVDTKASKGRKIRLVIKIISLIDNLVNSNLWAFGCLILYLKIFQLP